jgi:hypothetical protein
MFALFTQLLPWNGEGRDVSSFEAMYIAPHKETAKLVKKVHREPVQGTSFPSQLLLFPKNLIFAKQLPARFAEMVISRMKQITSLGLSDELARGNGHSLVCCERRNWCSPLKWLFTLIAS